MAKLNQVRGYDSPGVSYTEKEIKPNVQGPNQLVIGIIGTADKGPLGNTSIYNERHLLATFGDIGDHLGLLSAKLALKHSDHIIFNRVVSSNAKEGVGQDEHNLLKVSTKTKTSTLNGYKVEFKYDKESKVVSYRLITPDEKEIIESSIGYTLKDKNESSFLGTLFNKNSDYLNLEIIGDLPADPDHVSDGFKDVTITIDNGHSGTDITATDIVGKGFSGVRAFMSPDTVDVSTLITPGWSHESNVVKALEELTHYRGDVQVVIDTPKNLSVEDAIKWTNGKHSGLSTKLNNPWVAVYFPWVKIRGYDDFVPPSTIIASQWAYSDSTSECWFAPAGYGNNTERGRGYLADVVDTQIELTKEDRDRLYGGDNVINPIAKFIGSGVVLFGNKTTLRTKFGEAESMMTSLNVRRLCNFIRKLIVSVSYSELFNPNDRFTWNSWRLKLEPRFRQIQVNRGIEAFRIIMDETTVTETDIRAGRMPGLIYIKPIRASEFIPINFVVTDNDIYFSEEQGLEVGPNSSINTVR